MARYYNLLIAVIGGCMLLFCMACSEESICPDENHPHLIDLGLPNGTKWACCNVGSPSPEMSGGYYAWGETDIKSSYDKENYRHGELSNQLPQRMGNIAGSEYDVARKQCGSSWEMPSSYKWQELIDYCKWDWVKYKGHHGWKVTGPNGNKLFIPACGMKGGSELISEEEHGHYWASDWDAQERRPMSFDTNGGYYGVRPTISYVTYGFNVRPIESYGD